MPVELDSEHGANHSSVITSVNAPPRPPRSDGPVDDDELRALVEALIEEARQRARRRRRRYAACILVAAVAVGGVYFGVGRGGGSAAGSGSDEPGSSVGAPPASARWTLTRGPYGGTAYAVAVAPSKPSVVYLGTAAGVFRSVNGGRSWQRAGLAATSGWLSLASASVVSLAVDPRSPSTVYAVRRSSPTVVTVWRLFKTTDGGRSWHGLHIAAQLVFVGRAAVFAIVGRVGYDAKNRLLRSTDGGRSWQEADRGLGPTGFSGLAFDLGVVYAATSRGVLESTDDGTTWRALTHANATAVAVDPRHPRTLYAGTDDAVIESVDGGGSWRTVNTVLGGHGRDRGIGQVYSLVVSPLDSRRLYATIGCEGIFTSGDGGRTWGSANAGGAPDCLGSFLALGSGATVYAGYPDRGVFESKDGSLGWHAIEQGLDLTVVESLAVDPTDPQLVYAGAGHEGFFESRDGGLHWRKIGRGFLRVDAVATDASDPSSVLAAGPTHKLIRSADGGHTWQLGTGLAGNTATLAIRDGRAYAGTFGRGLFGSDDGGRSWRSLGPLKWVSAVAIAPDNSDVVYVGGGTVNDQPGGLDRSIDGGLTWQRLVQLDVDAVAIDPDHPTTLYVGTWERGVFRSTDDGATWQRTSSGLPRIGLAATTSAGKLVTIKQTVGVSALAIDPADPATLYAATQGRGIYRSTDAGASWHSFGTGLTVHDVRSLAIDATGRHLYAGLAYGGVASLKG